MLKRPSLLNTVILPPGVSTFSEHGAPRPEARKYPFGQQPYAFPVWLRTFEGNLQFFFRFLNPPHEFDMNECATRSTGIWWKHQRWHDHQHGNRSLHGPGTQVCLNPAVIPSKHSFRDHGDNKQCSNAKKFALDFSRSDVELDAVGPGPGFLGRGCIVYFFE